jgi:hypothetical protein
MSRVYFHSPSGTAELLGSERAWMGALVNDLAIGLLNLDWHADDVADLIRPDMSRPPSNRYHHTFPSWRQTFETSLKVGIQDPFVWRDRPINAFSLFLNTALAAGSDAIKLAARLHGQCEIHTWVDGPNRAWLADIIIAGVDSGVFRVGAGWDKVALLLLSRDDEPVVTSYSVGEGFPNRWGAEWVPPELPDDWRPEGIEADEWAAMGDDERDGCRQGYTDDSWYDLDDAEQWRLAMVALRKQPGLLELTPTNWNTFRFRHKLTVFDLLAADRDERLDAALPRLT